MNEKPESSDLQSGFDATLDTWGIVRDTIKQDKLWQETLIDLRAKMDLANDKLTQ